MSKKDSISELTTHVDRASKLLFKEYHDLLLELAFPGQKVSVVNIEENVEINLPTRPVDYLMTIAWGTGKEEQKRALHVEFYSAYKSSIPQTLFIYSGELTDRMNMKVLTIVIYSEWRDKEQRPKPEYTTDIKGQVINRFTYLDIWLMDYEEEIRSGKLAPLAPFLLEMTTIPTEETVFMAKRMAMSEANDERRQLLLSLVALLAGRHFDKEQVKTWFIKEAKMIRTNTFIDDWLEEAQEKGIQKGMTQGIELGREEGIQRGRKIGHEEGLTEGIQKGRQEGLTEGIQKGRQEGLTEGIQKGIEEGIQKGLAKGALKTRRHAILDLLGLRFDPPLSVYQQVEQRLNEIQVLSTLETIFMVAVRGESLSDLQAALSE